MKTLFLTIACIPACVFGQALPTGEQVTETLAVCDSMGMYVQAAQRAAASGVPREQAKDIVSALMNKNLKLDEAVKAGAIGLAGAIHDDVYVSPDGKTAPIDEVLGRTCGSYRGYNVARQTIEKHLALSSPSAWNPLVRVPVCKKVGESAANVATARDKGISREKIRDAAEASLKGDRLTMAVLPVIVSETYDNPAAEPAFVYLFNMGRCQAGREGRDYPSFASLMPEYARCNAAANVGAARDACYERAFKITP